MTNITDEMLRRHLLLQKHKGNTRLKALTLVRSSNEIVYWVNNWGWTYDPRLKLSTLPMVLYPKQAEFLGWLQDREDKQEWGIAEKSRDMGFTWLCAFYLVHHWLFRDGFKGGIGSRKQDLVDKIGDPDSIFEKMRFILRNLPKWMLPTNYEDAFLKFINHDNGSTITGEGGDNIGRGGRNSIYFKDEAAFIERAKLAEAALSNNTNCCIDISTPNGNANEFARKRASGNYPVFTMHWLDDPRKNGWQIVDIAGNVVASGEGGSLPPEVIPAGCLVIYPWYEEMKRRFDPVTIAQEVDIDYTASVEGIAIPAKWVKAAVELHKRITFPQSSSVVAGLDVADGGANITVLIVRSGCVVTNIYSRSTGNTTDTANWAINQAQESGVKCLNFDATGVGAGIAGTIATRTREGHLGIHTSGVQTGAAPSIRKWSSGKSSAEMFVNKRAELWWLVRERFSKTYEYVEEGVQYPLDELISIPNHPQLIAELSNVLYHTNETGKIRMEKKHGEMDKRGVASPDFADALVLSFDEPKSVYVYTSAGPARGNK